jgi:hypothetical protein
MLGISATGCASGDIEASAESDLAEPSVLSEIKYVGVFDVCAMTYEEGSGVGDNFKSKGVAGICGSMKSNGTSEPLYTLDGISGERYGAEYPRKRNDAKRATRMTIDARPLGSNMMNCKRRRCAQNQEAPELVRGILEYKLGRIPVKKRKHVGNIVIVWSKLDLLFGPLASIPSRTRGLWNLTA